MYCKWCGTKIDDGVKFCPTCGYEVNKIEEIDNKPQLTLIVNDNVDKPQNQTSNADKNAVQGFVFTLVSLFLTFSIIGIFLGIIFFIVGLICSSLGLKSVKNKGLAISGIIISCILAMVIILILIVMIGIGLVF